jgi:lipoprotein-anchoring transpeptidase ErfK/SrfK
MKRSSNQKENKDGSTRKMKMKTSPSLALFASICIASTFTTAAHAGSIANNKYGATINDTTGATTTSRVYYAPDLGTFTWLDENARVNHIVVSLADQTLNAFDGSTLVGYSNISSGKPGHETPTGTFRISQKDVDHHSSIYDNAPMPFYMRLTNYGVGLHGGFIPGYPASHGCIRLPLGMARELYEHTQFGTPVTVTHHSMAVAVQELTASTGVRVAQD